MNLNPEIWGPSFWFFLHTISFHYPLHPNDVIKKKYYDFIMNFHLFIPVEKISKEFNELVDKYPISPYLDSRDSFISWTHFIHNKINEKLEKPKISINEFYFRYYEEYKPKDIKMREYCRLKEKIIYTLVVMGATALIVYLYNK